MADLSPNLEALSEEFRAIRLRRTAMDEVGFHPEKIEEVVYSGTDSNGTPCRFKVYSSGLIEFLR